MLQTNLCGIKLRNPTVLASGVLGVTRESLIRVANSGAGAVIIKSVSKDERFGHNNPTVIAFEGGMMNAVGYSNAGLESSKKEFSSLKGVNAPVIASIIGTTKEDFAYMAKSFLSDEFAAVEIPLSCPHTPGFGTLAGQSTPKATYEITKAVKKNTKLPVIVKLSPNTQEIGKIAEAAEKAGADAINMGNTHGPGMIINIDAKKPVMDFKVGGLSGPMVKPVTVRCIYDIYQTVKIPIIGTGGVTYGRDALEMIMAGATAVGIGTGVYFRGIGVFKKVCDEMQDWMKKNKVKSLDEIRGAAHK
ncbi:dihydroorotate dehydrogenase [Candidatus Woesearchaeota archaeon]|nr:dihydroorotate dehydrogenase [Candidatus Woesearchaeota archaeon]